MATFGSNRTAEATLDVLRPVFKDCIINRRADVVWTPRNCDLTPLDCYLRSAVKNNSYTEKPQTIDALKDNIREAIGEIQLHTINNVLRNYTDRVGYCMASRGCHFKEFDLIFFILRFVGDVSAGSCTAALRLISQHTTY